MATSLTALCALIYVGVALSHVRDGNRPLALVFAAYAVANIGLIWSDRK